MIAKIKVIALAEIIGILFEKMPNNNHNNVPNAKSEYMNNDMPDVFFVCIVFMACGKKDMVVQVAATKPSIVM